MSGRSNKIKWLMICIESLDSSIRHGECQSTGQPRLEEVDHAVLKMAANRLMIPAATDSLNSYCSREAVCLETGTKQPLPSLDELTGALGPLQCRRARHISSQDFISH